MIKDISSLADYMQTVEGFDSRPYSDGFGYSIGYGHYIGTIPYYTYKGFVYSNVNPMPKFVARQILISDIEKRIKHFNDKIDFPFTLSQAKAITSWTFSLSPAGVRDSTLTNLIAAKESKEKISEWWQNHYVTVKGIIHSGLIARRKREVELFYSSTFPNADFFFSTPKQEELFIGFQGLHSRLLY